jgi:hypothetical protein
MTQKEILESVLLEIKHIKTHMPNGELKQMANDFQDMKDDISDNGVIVKTNQNTQYRKELQQNEAQFRNKLGEIEDIKRWKENVSRALWIIFGILATLIIRVILMHSE